MKKTHLSLRTSVLLTISIASAFLIAVFTHLLLTREAYRTTEHQIQETKLSLLLAKEVLESALEKKPGASAEEIASSLAKYSQHTELLENSILLDKNGVILYPAGRQNPHAAMDQKRIQEIVLTYNLTGQWFRPLPSPDQTDALDIFTPIFSGPDVRLVLKTTVTLQNLKNAFARTYHFVILIFLMVFLFAGFLAFRMKRKILDPLGRLTRGTSEIAAGNLDQSVPIEADDEIGQLANSFNEMAKKLLAMKSSAEDANPLTHLPGNNVITAEINKRLESGAKIAVIHADLDRFKLYNDLYGIQRGDEVIKMTAEVLKESVRDKGTPSDLVAHEGGDDFILVTTPARVDDVAHDIIARFDIRRGNHYREIDRNRGFILIPDRRSKDAVHAPQVEIPLMSISLAAVANESQSFSSYPAIAQMLVGMKKKAKGIRGSSFAISR